MKRFRHRPRGSLDADAIMSRPEVLTKPVREALISASRALIEAKL